MEVAPKGEGLGVLPKLGVCLDQRDAFLGDGNGIVFLGIRNPGRLVDRSGQASTVAGVGTVLILTS